MKGLSVFLAIFLLTVSSFDVKSYF